MATTLVSVLIAGIVCMGHGAEGFTKEENLTTVIPRPVKIELHEGAFTIGSETKILVSADTHLEGEYLAGLLRPATGWNLETRTHGAGDEPANCIILRTGLQKDQVGEEGYRLRVRADGVLLEASSPAGIFYGCQTLRQLLPAAIESPAKIEGVPWVLPVVTIEDQPRFPWRGLMLDVARVYYYKDWLKRYIDLMALYKMNRLHLHLTEHTGWRLDVPKYPNFVAQHAGVPDPRDPTGQSRMNQFYTQADLREIVAYADRCHVMVIPEIDMPGHFGGQYPEKMGCVRADGKWSAKANGVRTQIMCAGSAETFEVLDEILSEVAAVFPSPWIHIGGDEAFTNVWAECDRCQARMKAENLNGTNELFTSFVKRVEKIIQSKNKRMMGWEEVAAAQSATLQSWHGTEPGLEGARRGQDCIMSPSAFYYLDSSPKQLNTKRVYSLEPISAELPDDKVRHVLGVEGPMWMDAWGSWANFTPKPGTLERVDRQIFPRLIALSETGWSAKNARDWESFRARLKQHAARLKNLGVTYYQDPGVWSD